MNADWKVEKAQYAEFNVPTCGKIAVWQLCRERQPFWNSHDGLNLTCLDQCHGFRWLTPKNCYTVYSLNLIDELTSLFSPKVIVAGLPRESLPCLCGHRCFSVVAHQDSPKASPRAILKWMNLIEPLKLLSQWMTGGESWMPTCANMCHSVPTWANIAVCQLCRERQPFWNSHDGLNLTCLDQCHGVGSHGTSSSQGWRKRIVIQRSEFDPWVHIFIFGEGDCCRFAWESLPMEIGKSRHWTSVFFCREFHRATQAIAQMHADWNVEKAQYAEFNVPICAKIAVWQLCRERQPFLEQSWWPEFDMFGSMPWFSLAAAKELSKFDRILVFAEGDCCRFA